MLKGSQVIRGIAYAHTQIRIHVRARVYVVVHACPFHFLASLGFMGLRGQGLSALILLYGSPNSSVRPPDPHTHEAAIVQELNGAQGEAMDLRGYYRTDAGRTASAMRPSATLNGIIDGI